MIIKTRKITYNSYKKILNKVAYKLIKSGKTFKHTKTKYRVGNEYQSYNEILKAIKKNGKNTNNDKFIARFMEDVITNTNYKQLPTSIIGSSGKYKYYRGHYRGMVKTVRAYKKKHGKNPEKIIVQYSPVIKLHDYITETGCSGMGQCTPHNCADNSLQQCFYRLTGIRVSESEIAEWAGTTSDGTDHEGINTAVEMFNRKYNKNVKIVWYNFSELGFDKCKELMKKGALFFHLLYRNRYGHYEVPKEIYDNTLDILNSLGDKCGESSYCGYIENRTKAEQLSYINGISQKSVAYLYNG